MNQSFDQHFEGLGDEIITFKALERIDAMLLSFLVLVRHPMS